MTNVIAYKLRHRVDIQSLENEQDSETGDITETWVTVRDPEDGPLFPAEVAPLSGREYVAAAAVQKDVTTRITIRYRADVTEAMRVVHGADVYNIRAVLPDPTLRRWLTLMCTRGSNEG